MLNQLSTYQGTVAHLIHEHDDSPLVKIQAAGKKIQDQGREPNAGN